MRLRFAPSPTGLLHVGNARTALFNWLLARAIAHGQQGADATDEASLAEQLGQTVLLVPGDPRNLKITTAADLAFARGLLIERGEVS